MANVAANNQAPAFDWRNPATWDGDAITRGLRAFNNWRDDFLIELTTLLLMVGFVVGTVDVLTSGSLSKVGFINYAWAIVQAVAIDGLFFAVWGRIRRFHWTWRSSFQGVMLIFVGLLLAIVAALVNNILGYQQVNDVASLSQVMATLGVDATVFSYVRSTLVVLVSVLVALFARGNGPSVRELSATIAQHVEELEGLRAIRETLTKERDSHSERATALEKERNDLQVKLTDTERERANLETLREQDNTRWAGEREQLNAEITELKLKLVQARARRENHAIATLPTRGTGLQAYARPGYSPRAGEMTITEIAQEPKAIAQASGGSNGYHSPEQVATPGNDSPAQTATPENGSPEQVATPGNDSPEGEGYVAIDNGLSIAIANEYGATIIATGEPRERIKKAMAVAMRNKLEVTYGDIAQVANVGYSTVKKHASAIKNELTGEIPAIAAPVTQVEENAQGGEPAQAESED